MLLAAANDNGCCFGHHCCRWASLISIKHRGQYKLINFYFNLLNLLNRFDGVLEKSCTRPLTPQVAWVHQIHASWGVGGSTTMVMVFIGLCVVCFGLVWSLSLVVCRQVWENNPTMGLWVWQSGPPRLAPYLLAPLLPCAGLSPQITKIMMYLDMVLLKKNFGAMDSLPCQLLFLASMPQAHCLFNWLHCHGFIAISMDSLPQVHCCSIGFIAFSWKGDTTANPLLTCLPLTKSHWSSIPSIMCDCLWPNVIGYQSPFAFWHPICPSAPPSFGAPVVLWHPQLLTCNYLWPNVIGHQAPISFLAHLLVWQSVPPRLAPTKMIRVWRGTKTHIPYDSYDMNSLKSNVDPNTTIPQTLRPCCGDVCLSYGVVSVGLPDCTRVTFSEGFRWGQLYWV